METWLAWLVLGFILVIIELVSGTFYLLVLGVGAFAAAVAAWLGANHLVQAVVGAAVAIAGAYLVHSWHAKNRGNNAQASNFLDGGQAVVLESWVDENRRTARVKYRGTTWDARIVGAAAPSAPGSTLYIEGQEGSTLLVGTAPPAPSAP
jgi:membrane protein implicated in regulation of membrane protease activity